MRIHSFLLSLALLFAGMLTTNAQTTIPATDVPRTISYQGILTDNNGIPFVDGRYGLTVTLYSDEHGTQQVWQQTYTTAVTGGVFNLYLGSAGKPLPTTSELNTSLWIGTSVDGGAEMRPLTPLSASPYALNVPDNAIVGNKIAEKAVTAEKVDMDYISELRINGQKVSGKGTVLDLRSSDAIALSYDAATQSVTIGKAASTTGTAGDEKGAAILANPDQVWSTGGDGWDIAAGAAYTPVAGDWLGTTTAIDLEFKVEGESVMLYQTTGVGNIPNVIGGQGNTITASSAVGSIIAEGTGNSITDCDYNSIGGGSANSITKSDYSAVVGGESNSIDDGPYSFIGGGASNSINLLGGLSPFDHSTIGGGFENVITGGVAVIGGGLRNRVDGAGGTIAGGGSNIISAIYANNTIGGGGQNEIIGASGHSTIGGGVINTITDSWYSAIGAGEFNSIANGDRNWICAGSNNHIWDNTFATIGGGFWNVIAGSDHSTISGGEEHRIMTAGTNHATIGGGRKNTVNGSYGTIPGGELLTVGPSYAQTAVGFYNRPRGTVPVHPTAGQIAASNDPLFMVGNGVVGAVNGSNAFEVSYNGHTTVYGVNGPGSVSPAIKGATYVDNVIYAWGDIDAAGGINSDFGVQSITQTGPGVYDITITVTDAFGNPATLTNASITATVIDEPSGDMGCAEITTTRMGAIGANMFRIRTYVPTGSGCQPADLPFMFKVTGRP